MKIISPGQSETYSAGSTSIVANSQVANSGPGSRPSLIAHCEYHASRVFALVIGKHVLHDVALNQDSLRVLKFKVVFDDPLDIPRNELIAVVPYKFNI